MRKDLKLKKMTEEEVIEKVRNAFANQKGEPTPWEQARKEIRERWDRELKNMTPEERRYCEEEGDEDE